MRPIGVLCRRAIRFRTRGCLAVGCTGAGASDFWGTERALGWRHAPSVGRARRREREGEATTKLRPYRAHERGPEPATLLRGRKRWARTRSLAARASPA